MEFGKTLEVWWSFVWRYIVFAFGAGFIIGLLVFALGGDTSKINTDLLSNILAFPISLFVFHLILKKYFGKKEETK